MQLSSLILPVGLDIWMGFGIIRSKILSHNNWLQITYFCALTDITTIFIIFNYVLFTIVFNSSFKIAYVMHIYVDYV